jgi:DNA-directed RNA polymerase specialized sigma24 family protein
MPDCEPLQPHISPSDFMSRWLAISPSVERFCMRRLANREECGEIMQQVAFNAWSGYPSLREINCFEAWIFKLAHNEINRLIRYKMRFRATSVSPSALTKNEPLVLV